MTAPMLAALKALIANGTYTQDPHEVGLAGRRDHRTEDQRRDELERVKPVPSSEVTSPTGRPEEIRAVPVRHPGRWIAAAIVLVIAPRSSARS